MIFTPGPAVVFIPAGLAMLATEFQCGRAGFCPHDASGHLIDAAIEKGKQTKRGPRRQTPAKRAASAPACPVEQPETESPEGESPARSAAASLQMSRRTGGSEADEPAGQSREHGCSSR